MDKKKKSGRPPKYATETSLAKVISDYFGECDEKKKMPNKAGLCLFLGISRETYSEYRERFSYAIKGADALIEDAWVQRLNSNAPTGAIFYLKNAFKEHYKDKQEVDLGGQITISWLNDKNPNTISSEDMGKKTS